MNTFEYILIATLLRLSHQGSKVPTPDWIWPNDYGVSGQHASVYYANDGSIRLEAVQLNGTSNSYIETVNNVSISSFTWVCYVFPNTEQEAVILEYYQNEDGPRIQFLQFDSGLKVKIYSSNGLVAENSKDGLLDTGMWNFVGFSYKSNKQNKKNKPNKVMVGTSKKQQKNFEIETMLTADSFSTVQIGASNKKLLPFDGLIGCVQFFEEAVKKISKLDKNCDLTLWNAKVIDSATTTVPTITTTKSTTTKESVPTTASSSTTPEPTATPRESTTNTIDSTISQEPVTVVNAKAITETSTTRSTTAKATTTTAIKTVTELMEEFPKDSMVYRKSEENKAFGSSSVILLEANGVSLVECASYCMKMPECTTFTFVHNPAHTCKLATAGQVTLETGQHSTVYSVTPQ